MTKKSITPKVRCAIYTRVSTDEGLDQEFNSLDAQREASEAYIASQKQEGWITVPDHYDDGGFSGGTLDRPALKRLIEDIKSDRIQVVVVYKIDRLSRSLIDFTKLVDIFDQHGVTFVSVTQSFNTTTSMGRLTLNILLSFAQFERETITERIRDKVAASKRKGLWMGGFPSLGYDIENRRLIVNQEEAELIRHIYKRFTQVGSGTLLVKELNDAGYRTKSWTSKSTNTFHAGKLFDKGSLYRILNNRVYIGEVHHKGKHFPGEHKAIIDGRLWDDVHSILSKQSRKRGNQTRCQSPAPLKSLIQCSHCNRAMTTTHTRKKGKLYRYYLCMQSSKNSYADCPVGTISANEIEELVRHQLQGVIQNPELVAKTIQAVNQNDPPIPEKNIIDSLKMLEPIWNELFPGEQARLTKLLIAKVDVDLKGVNVHFRVEGLNSLIKELGI
jgi:site-specific DNA recombinase